MDESQRIRLLQEQSIKYVSRWRPRDSSEITLELQAKAAAAYVVAQKVSGTAGSSGCQFTAAGRENNSGFLAILQGKQGCAVCSDPGPTSSTVALGVEIPAPCNNYLAPPFTQQNLSTPYVVCTTPANNYFFPPKASALPGCSNVQQRLFLPS
jgi:hypothetical protein